MNVVCSHGQGYSNDGQDHSNYGQEHSNDGLDHSNHGLDNSNHGLDHSDHSNHGLHHSDHSLYHSNHGQDYRLFTYLVRLLQISAVDNNLIKQASRNPRKLCVILILCSFPVFQHFTAPTVFLGLLWLIQYC